MKAAVISDIHSNYFALKAVVDNAISRDVNCFIFLGDYVSDLSEPIKTMDLIYDVRSNYLTYCLRGNRERYMIEYDNTRIGFDYGTETGSLLYTYQHLRKKDILFFKGLKQYDVINLGGVNVEIAHASKDDDRCKFGYESKNISNIFGQMKTDYFITGHIHRQYAQKLHNKTIINPGSVGVPQDNSWFSKYAILNIDDGNVSYEFCKVSYNIEDTIRCQFQSGLINYSKYWATGVLYDIITGEDWIVKLLEMVYEHNENPNDLDWELCAKRLEMKFNENEILELLQVFKMKCNEEIKSNTTNCVISSSNL